MKTVITTLIPSTSITPSFNSAAYDTGQILYVSAQVITTGTSPTFTVKLQASNDNYPPGTMASDFTPTNWTDIPNTTVSVSATGSMLIPKTEICYRWVRAAVTFTSGTGTVIVNLFGISV